MHSLWTRAINTGRFRARSQIPPDDPPDGKNSAVQKIRRFFSSAVSCLRTYGVKMWKKLNPVESRRSFFHSAGSKIRQNDPSGGWFFFCERPFFFENRQNGKILQNTAERGFANALLVLVEIFFFPKKNRNLLRIVLVEKFFYPKTFKSWNPRLRRERMGHW